MSFLDKLKGQNRISKSILRNWDKLSEEKQSELLSTLQKSKKNNNKQEEVNWDTAIREKILDEIKDIKITIEENTEMMWYKWKKVHIKIPAIKDFEWFNFDYFVSYSTFWSELELEVKKNLYSMEEIANLLQATNKYITRIKWNIDDNKDYEDNTDYETILDTKYRDAWKYLKIITWLNSSYWLSDTDTSGIRGTSRAVLECNSKDHWFISRASLSSITWYSLYHAKLFLKLSD